MPQRLPDITSLDTALHPMPLDWVGMKGIDLPVVIEEADSQRELHARVDAAVNLPHATVRGIHMSRLHQLVDGLGDGRPLTPRRFTPLLAAMVDSHKICGTNRARVRLDFALLVRRRALESADIGGWRSYPVVLEAVGADPDTTLRAQVRVAYSSTCPCSASLSRQLLEEAFLRTFGDRRTVSATKAAAWLRENGTLATPHGQRSEACVSVDVGLSAESFGLLTVIDRAERALATPLQTAVRRIDEQSFAARNGQNLMFVEDATRRIREALAQDYGSVQVGVTHMESLHPHDAVASAGF